MVNDISNIRSFEFHIALSISHHTQFLDKGFFLSQHLISEAVTFYCKFHAGEIIVMSGITEHFYIVAGYRSWSIRCCCKHIFDNVIFTAQGIVAIFSKPLPQHMSTNTGHMRQLSEWVLGDIFHICRVHLRWATNTDSISLRSHSVTP